jgi:pimeloyl-ACP methyl ester carboxylesterase
VAWIDELWRVPIWREGRVLLEAARLRRWAHVDPGLRRGDGPPVLLIPGYLAGDGSLAPLAHRLRGLGYAPQHAAIAANVDCATRTADRLVERLKTITDAHGQRAVIVGHSLGGVLGRLLAVRRPDVVGGVVCLGSPLVDLRAVHPLVWTHVRLVSMLGDLGVPGLLSRGCLDGTCCADSRDLMQSPFPADVGFVSIYSRSDGVVHWRSCLDAAAEHVEVDSTHLGMAVSATVHEALAERLAGLGDNARRSIDKPALLASVPAVRTVAA